MTLGKLVIKCPRKPREDLWKSRVLRGHLITNFLTCYGINHGITNTMIDEE